MMMYGYIKNPARKIIYANQPNSKLFPNTIINHSIHTRTSIPFAYHGTQLLNNIGRRPSQIQFRDVRHKAGKEGSLGTGSTTTDSSSTTEDEKMDPEKMQKKFQEFVQEFMKNYSWSSVLNQTNRKKFHTELDEFVKKFNEEHAEKFGFKIEREAVEKNQMNPRYWFIAAVIMFGILWTIRPRITVLPEHQTILNQPPITLDQFIHDYLNVGEVQMVFYYPVHNKLVAYLHPGAIIQGQQFVGSAVHVKLDDYFRYSPHKLVLQIREIERQLGVDANDEIRIGIRNPPYFAMFIYTLGSFGILIFCYRQWFRQMHKSLFRVMPTQKAGSGMRKNKEPNE